MSRRSSREKILDASEKIVIAEGAGHMPIETIAQKAGVSRGGLLYNFPTKDKLLEAMLERLVKRFKDARYAEHAKLKPETKARELKAHMSSFFRVVRKENSISAAVLAMAAHSPKMLAPIQKARRELFEEIVATSDLDSTRASVIMAAIDGIWLINLLGISFMTPDDEKKAMAELRKLAENWPDEKNTEVKKAQN